MNIVEVRKIVGQIKAQLFNKSNSYSIGMLKSHFRGSGLQFKEHRQYTHGDDVRFIDWKILAKTGDPFIKTFEEERNVEIAVVIDASSSMMYGWKNISKLQAALEITCMLYLLAAETNDNIHAIILSDEIIDVPMGRGEKGITQFIASMVKNGIFDEHGKLKLQVAQDKSIPFYDKERAIKKHLARSREVVVLTDWIEFLPEEVARKITIDKHSHCFRLLAPLDVSKKLPLSFKVAGESDGGGVRSFSIKDENRKKDIQRIKDLNVKDRYLDEFIREMI